VQAARDHDQCPPIDMEALRAVLPQLVTEPGPTLTQYLDNSTYRTRFKGHEHHGKATDSDSDHADSTGEADPGLHAGTA
jgi:hypothetical protein